MKKVTGLAPFALAILLFSGSAGAADYTASVEPIASWTGPYAAHRRRYPLGRFRHQEQKIEEVRRGHEHRVRCRPRCSAAMIPAITKPARRAAASDPCAPAIKCSEYECDTDLAAPRRSTLRIPSPRRNSVTTISGFFGTVQIGYNHEIASPLVVGIFASADFGEKLKIHETEDSGSSMPTATTSRSFRSVPTSRGRLRSATSSRSADASASPRATACCSTCSPAGHGRRARPPMARIAG